MTPATASTFELKLMGLQRTAAGFCIALLLVAGLVSVPTSCVCGAGIAHGHSLFILRGHHHGPDGAVFGTAPIPDEHQHHDHHGHHAKESPSVESQAQIAGRIMHSSDRVVIAIPVLDASASTWQRVTYAPYSETANGSHVVLPEPPPPQQLQTS
jgi:hypothetical protein